MILAALLAAAAPPLIICTDRPGKGDSPCTAPAGHFQVETALVDWTLQRSAGERDTSLVLGASAIKYGLTDRSHIELDVSPVVRTTIRTNQSDDSEAGFGDLVVRYKQQLTAPGAALQVAAFPFVKLPTAKRPLGNGKLEAGIELPTGYSIKGSPLSLGFAPQLAWLANRDGSGRHAAMVQTASVGWQATPKLNLSAELWGQWDWDPRGSSRQYSADMSAAYLATNRIQLDAGANVGLNRVTPDVELYAGASVLF